MVKLTSLRLIRDLSPRRKVLSIIQDSIYTPVDSSCRFLWQQRQVGPVVYLSVCLLGPVASHSQSVIPDSAAPTVSMTTILLHYIIKGN